MTVNTPAIDHNNLGLVAIGGAGAAGVAAIGAVLALDKHGLLTKKLLTALDKSTRYLNFSGTSAGAILAAPLAIGYRGKALENLVMEQDFSRFMLPKLNDLANLRKSLKLYGLFTGNELEVWTGLMIAQKLGNPQLSFGELRQYREAGEAGNLDFFKEKLTTEEGLRSIKAAANYCHRLGKGKFSLEFMPENWNGKPLADEALTIAATTLMHNAAAICDLHVTAAEVTVNPEKKADFLTRIWHLLGAKTPEQEAEAHSLDIGKLHYSDFLFNADTTPNVPIAQAVKASASFPFFFRHTEIETDYQDGSKVKSFSDGGMTNLTPINVLQGTLPDNQCMGIQPAFRSGEDCGFPILPFTAKHEAAPPRNFKKKVRVWAERQGEGFARQMFEFGHNSHAFFYGARNRIELALNNEERGPNWLKKPRRAAAEWLMRFNNAVERIANAEYVPFKDGAPLLENMQKYAEITFGRDPVQYTWRLLEDQIHNVSPEDEARITYVDRGNVGPIDFFIGKPEKTWLLGSGFDGMETDLLTAGVIKERIGFATTPEIAPEVTQEANAPSAIGDFRNRVDRGTDPTTTTGRHK